VTAVVRALVRESMERDRRRLVAALRKAEDMPQTSKRKCHEREVLIGRRTRELEAHDRLIEGYGA